MYVPCSRPVSMVLAAAVVLFAGTTRADHLSTGLGYAQSAAINTESAVPLARGGWSVGVRTEFVQNGSFSDNELIDLRVRDIQKDGVVNDDLHSVDYVLGGSLNLAYGFTDNLTFGVRLPYVKRNDIREPEEGHAHGTDPIIIHNVIEHGDSAGIGDITVSGMYRFFSDSNNDIAVLFGVKTPTGETNQKGFRNEKFVKTVDTGVPPGAGGGHEHSGRRLETHQQPGSGSWDALLGMAWSRAVGTLSLDASALYTYVTEGSQETDLGDLVSYNLAVSGALDRAAPCDGCTWNLVMELNGEWRDKEDVSGERTDSSGGHLLYLSPGVRLSGPRGWSVAVSAGYPVVKDLNGDQSEPDYRLVGVLGYSF